MTNAFLEVGPVQPLVVMVITVLLHTHVHKHELGLPNRIPINGDLSSPLLSMVIRYHKNHYHIHALFYRSLTIPIKIHIIPGCWLCFPVIVLISKWCHLVSVYLVRNVNSPSLISPGTLLAKYAHNCAIKTRDHASFMYQVASLWSCQIAWLIYGSNHPYFNSSRYNVFKHDACIKSVSWRYTNFYMR